MFTSFKAINYTKYTIVKYLKDSLENRTRKLVICQEMSRFGILGFLCIHACAVNVKLELLENVYFSF